MSSTNFYQLAVAAFHSAIDYEQSNKNEEAFIKYAEGLELIGTSLKTKVGVLNLPNVYSRQKKLLEFAQRSVERLVILLEKSEQEASNQGLSVYQNLSNSLPEVITDRPVVPANFRDEVPEYLSPLSALEDDKRRIIKCYESQISSIMDTKAKTNLRLELERRLAENDSLAKSRFEQWEQKRKALAEECQNIAQQKFNTQQKINNREVHNSDFTKQNLYAACLQYHKEHPWAQEASCRIFNSAEDECYVKKIVTFILQHKTHPLACMFRQAQDKVISKLSKLSLDQTVVSKNDKIVLDNHLKNIIQDIKEDLFILNTVIQTIWEPLANETNHLLIVDVLHNLFFPPVKPQLIKIFRISLHEQEENLEKIFQNMTPFSQHFDFIINRLQQLPLIHSPTAMMTFLVKIIKTYINVICDKDPNNHLVSLAVGIDDLMPKLIELILNCKIPSLPAEMAFVENFIPAKKAIGEEGYAVTLMQSVLCYIYNNRNSLNNSS